jgi:hypothetical protein
MALNLVFLNFENYLSSKFPLSIQIRIGSGFNNFVDPDPSTDPD